MILLSQRDPAYANVHLGASSLSVHDYGCTTVCMSMLTDYFKGFMSPVQIATHSEWYTKDGLVLWGKMNFPTMKFEKRLRTRNDFEIMASVEDPNKAVLVEVQLPKGGRHWLVVLGKELLGKGYRVVDPWTGKKSTTSVYHNLITGSAHFIRK